MKFLKYLAFALCCLATVACQDEISMIGSSLNTSNIEITVDSAFVKLTGESVYVDSIIGRTTDPLIGNLTVENYGSLRTGFLTQFMPTLDIDTTHVTLSTLDSIKLYLNYYTTDLTGDSLAPMVMDVYRLNKTLVAPLYTNIDPLDYYSPQDWLASTTFGSSEEGFSDSNTTTSATTNTSSSSTSASTQNTKTYKRIAITLPIELGQEIFSAYKEDPDIFSMPWEFSKIFPGLYLNVSYGNGRLVNIKGIFMTMHYRSIDERGDVDTLALSYMGVTPEVYSINHFSLTPDQTLLQNIEKGNSNKNRVYVQAPIGYIPVIHFPAQNIIDKYNEKMSETTLIQNILNALTFSIPITTDETWPIDPPSHLLFIRESQVTDFFENKLLPDNTNTVYATYDKANKRYNFGNIGSYIRNILNREDPTVTPDDEKIALIPVQVDAETSTNYYTTTTTVTNITPYCASPTIVGLDLEGAMIKIIYTTQKPVSARK